VKIFSAGYAMRRINLSHYVYDTIDVALCSIQAGARSQCSTSAHAIAELIGWKRSGCARDVVLVVLALGLLACSRN
jgi:hypothetical protein